MVSRQSELPAPADPAPGLDGRGFTAAATDGPGDADAQTVFDYHEDDGMVWAEYAGGRVICGYFVGTRVVDELSFRHVHLTSDGGTASDHCISTVMVGADGKVELHETWERDSKLGSGTSVLTEVV